MIKRLTVKDVKNWLDKWPDDMPIGAGGMHCDCVDNPIIFVGHWVRDMNLAETDNGKHLARVLELDQYEFEKK